MTTHEAQGAQPDTERRFVDPAGLVLDTSRSVGWDGRDAFYGEMSSVTMEIDERQWRVTSVSGPEKDSRTGLNVYLVHLAPAPGPL